MKITIKRILNEKLSSKLHLIVKDNCKDCARVISWLKKSPYQFQTVKNNKIPPDLKSVIDQYLNVSTGDEGLDTPIDMKDEGPYPIFIVTRGKRIVGYDTMNLEGWTREWAADMGTTLMNHELELKPEFKGPRSRRHRGWYHVPIAEQRDSSAANLKTIKISGKSLKVNVATTEAEQSKGLMNTPNLQEDTGMLFEYPQEKTLSFWMKDTAIPLSIAFIDKSKKITEIRDMSPGDEESIVSKSPAQWALEVNQGWFERNNIKEGDTVFFGSSKLFKVKVKRSPTL